MYSDPKTQCRPVRVFAKASTGTGANNGTGFKKTGFDYLLLTLDLGTLGTAATVDVKMQECATLGGTYVDVAGAAFTQRVKASDDNAMAPAQMKLSGRKAFLRAVVTVGAAASVVGVNGVLMGPDRTEQVSIAQGASEAVACPTAASGAGAYEFSV